MFKNIFCTGLVLLGSNVCLPRGCSGPSLGYLQSVCSYIFAASLNAIYISYFTTLFNISLVKNDTDINNKTGKQQTFDGRA